jgi:hypothetical protein
MDRIFCVIKNIIQLIVSHTDFRRIKYFTGYLAIIFLKGTLNYGFH